MPFLAACHCDGDSCICNDAATGEHILASKGNSQMNSILEKMKAAGIKLDDLKASAPSLPLADLKALNTALADEIRAKEAQTSKKTQRLARMAAAKAAAELNPAVERMITLANAELKRLDVKIDEFAVGGSVAKLDKLMAAANWPNLRKIQLKGTLHSIGVIE